MDVTEQLHQLQETVKSLSQQLDMQQKKIQLLEEEMFAITNRQPASGDMTTKKQANKKR